MSIGDKLKRFAKKHSGGIGEAVQTVASGGSLAGFLQSYLSPTPPPATETGGPTPAPAMGAPGLSPGVLMVGGLIVVAALIIRK